MQGDCSTVQLRLASAATWLVLPTLPGERGAAVDCLHERPSDCLRCVLCRRCVCWSCHARRCVHIQSVWFSVLINMQGVDG